MTRRLRSILVLLVAGATTIGAQQASTPTTRELAEEISRLSQQIVAQQPVEPLPCTYTIAPATVQRLPAAGGPVALTVTPTPTGPACSWGVTAPDAWAQPDILTGAGAGTVTVTVAANPTTAVRTSTLTVATVAVVLSQAAAPTSSGTTVATAAELTAALPAGGEIHVRPGRYAGNFRIVKPTVLIGLETLPAARVAAGATAAVTLAPAAAGDYTVRVAASDVTLQGLTIQSGSIDRSTVLIGDPDNRDVSTLPDRVLVDRVEVTADPAVGGLRGIEIHARGVTVTRSRVTGYWHKSRDAQAIYACNGPGPLRVEDNWLEASGENVLVGGGSIRTAAHHPRDVVIVRNTLYKPQTWRALGAVVKNSLECKACDGALLEDNAIDGNWTSGQTGNPIVLTPRNQYNDSPWTVVQNVIVRRNRTANTPDGYLVQILGTDNNAPTRPTRNITIESNLHTGRALVVTNGGLEGDLILRNNTAPFITHAVLTFNDGSPQLKPARCILERNVWRHGRYAINSQSAGQGYTTLDAYCAASTVAGNVIEESNGSTYYWGRWPKGAGELLPLGGLPPRLDPTTYKYLPGGAGY